MCPVLRQPVHNNPDLFWPDQTCDPVYMPSRHQKSTTHFLNTHKIFSRHPQDIHRHLPEFRACGTIPYVTKRWTASGWVCGFIKIIPLCGSILQAGTCHIFCFSENPRLSRVWRYPPVTYQTPWRSQRDTFKTTSRPSQDYHQTHKRHHLDTLKTLYRHS